MKPRIFCLLLTLFLGCNERKPLPDILSNQNDDFKRLIVIPYMGCIGCTKDAIQVLEKHNDFPATLFVITKIAGVKTVKIELNQLIDLNNALNVRIDKENELLNELEVGIFPLVYDVEGNILDNRVEVKSVSRFLSI